MAPGGFQELKTIRQLLLLCNADLCTVVSLYAFPLVHFINVPDWLVHIEYFKPCVCPSTFYHTSNYC